MCLILRSIRFVSPGVSSRIRIVSSAFLYNALMLSEFDLIAKYFTRPLRRTDRCALGVGDDCALLTPSPGMQIAVSTDMLVEGRHFFAGAEPAKLGHKCLAVNLSDLAAMGAKPLAFTLALALPEANPDWLAAFSGGLLALADLHDCELIGGDTTKGPLTICITVFGEVPLAAALRRDAAKIDDDIWVSGTLGDARLALAGYRDELRLEPAAQQAAGERMHAPTPRVALGLALRGIAHAAIDISDGLCGDLQHILDRSQVGASLHSRCTARRADIEPASANAAPQLLPGRRRRLRTLLYRRPRTARTSAGRRAQGRRRRDPHRPHRGATRLALAGSIQSTGRA